MLKKLPVGVDGFKKIRTQDFYYVDKTMFIAELLENWGEVNLFTRPRRFGKTLTMDMLKNFFEIGCDRELFDGLKISGEKELCEKHMGQYPVIAITLKDVSGDTFFSACNALRNKIGKEVLRFRFLAESTKLSEEERAIYLQMIQVGNENGAFFAMPDSVLVESLGMLTQLLSKHYEKKVIILIDEYDVPLDKAFQNGYYDEMVFLIRNLFGNALKSNNDLQFAVLTGCLRISKESIFTGLNNLKVYTITDVRYDEYFGFTSTDVDEMLAFYGLTAYKGMMREWYDGYLFGKVSVYCPWDIINYCDELLADEDAEPENYWANTSGNDLVRRLIGKADKNTKDEIEQLVNGGTIIKAMKNELTYRDIDESMDNVWSVLLATGYLTYRGHLPGRQLKLTIPNKEVRELFMDQAKEWFRETTRNDSSRITCFCAAFPAGDVSLIQDMLHDYLWDSISVRDTAVRKNRKENFYHGLVLGLLQSQGNWLIRSNEELGEGYSDISICTPEKTGIVIELKYADDGNLQKGCADALRQIEERKYADGLKRKGMKKIIKYGMAFCEKECMVICGIPSACGIMISEQ